VYVYYDMCMPSKLVRKQLLLDPEDLFYVEQIIKKQSKYTSLSQYVRELLKKQIQENSQPKSNRKQKMLDLAGSVSPATNSHPNSAANHNDIYDT
jgi:hypothetical protein